MSKRRRRRAAITNLNQFTGGFDPKKIVADPNFKPVDPTNAKLGWRAWAVDRELPPYGNPPKLCSVTHSYFWAPKQKAEAECGYEDDHNGVPGQDCGCGFYSAKNLRHLMNMGYHQYNDIDTSKQFKVVGQVACWGKVIEGTQGWRSQFCYPTYLMVPFEVGAEFGRALKDAYGAKVRLLNFLIDPKDITDEIIEGLLAGRPQMRPLAQPKINGRRVEHKVLRFTGRTQSDAYEKNEKKVIDVAWDMHPERTVVIALDSLTFESV